MPFCPRCSPHTRHEAAAFSCKAAAIDLCLPMAKLKGTERAELNRNLLLQPRKSLRLQNAQSGNSKWGRMQHLEEQAQLRRKRFHHLSLHICMQIILSKPTQKMLFKNYHLNILLLFKYIAHPNLWDFKKQCVFSVWRQDLNNVIFPQNHII